MKVIEGIEEEFTCLGLLDVVVVKRKLNIYVFYLDLLIGDVRGKLWFGGGLILGIRSLVFGMLSLNVCGIFRERRLGEGWFYRFRIILGYLG